MASPSFPQVLVRILCGFSVCSLALILFSAAHSNAQADDENTAVVSARQGGAIYHQRCIGCHNKKGSDDSPFGPPNLYIALSEHGPLSPKQAQVIVTHGKGPMPAFGHVLSQSEIRSVIAYLRSEGRH